MTKKHFIELAKILAQNPADFTETAKRLLADFCAAQNSNFDKACFLAAAGVKPSKI
jgi:hypothetical protein